MKLTTTTTAPSLVSGSNHHNRVVNYFTKPESAVTSSCCKQQVAHTRTMAPRARNNDPAAEPEAWIKSRAKAKLRLLLMDESSWVQLCTPEQIHESDDDFKQYPLVRFKVNFNTLKSSIELERTIVAFDDKAVKEHQQKFPRNATTERGYKFWNKHPAEKRLQEAVKLGATSNRKPSSVQQDHPDFQEFPLPVFRTHLYQEQRKKKESPFWQKKRNEKAHKAHRDAEDRRRNNEL